MVGVAYRGQIPLQDIRVDFQVEAVARPDAPGFGVRKTVTLHGPISETEQRRLHRTAEYCPVGQLFTKGALALEDQVTYSAESVASAAAAPSSWVLPPSADAPLPLPPGAVHGRYLADTKGYTDSGVLQHEGEVKVYLTCANLTRPGRQMGIMPLHPRSATLRLSSRPCTSPQRWSLGILWVDGTQP